jgi:radical SAM protein with 4Fe4S-binding SPASM domain
MSYENRLCLIPEAGLNVTPSGNITPCCVAPEHKLGHISTDSLSSVFYGKEYSEFREAHRQGQLPDVCMRHCGKQNNNYVHISGRNQIVRNSEVKEVKEHNKEKLIMVDIGIGNVCNLTCVFCNETWSSSWAKLKNDTANIFHFDKETTLGIARDLKDAIYVSFKGGEPLNIPHLDEFLEELFKATNDRNCMISLLTNGTETNERINNALFNFKVSLGISTEATGPLYQYLRGGKYTWDNVLTNIQSFVDKGCVDIHIASIISLYNYTKWADDMLKIQQQLKGLINRIDIGAQLCTSPEEQSLFLLNRSERQRLVDSIKRNVDAGLEIIGVESLIENIMTDRPVHTTRQRVLENIQYNNKLRNMDLFSIVEDFTDHLVL